MKGLGITVTEHLLIHQKESPAATGRLTRLLQELIFAAKIISREVNKAGLVDILGLTGDINVQGERVRKLDDFSNHAIIYRMERAGVICAMASEENADIIPVPEDMPKEDYILIFDPLDGSSNIDVNVNIGTIFSIHRKVSERPYVTLDDFLRRGSKQVAAGYFVYGPSTMLVYTTGKGVNGFTLDPSVGEFLLSHQNITIPERGKVYSVNEAYTCYWDERTKKVVDYFKSRKTRRESLTQLGILVLLWLTSTETSYMAAYSCIRLTRKILQSQSANCASCARLHLWLIFWSRHAWLPQMLNRIFWT